MELDLKPVQSQRLYRQVIDQIRQLILKGQLRPGQQLPSEKALMERFNVGRSTIREAFAVLETLGIIELSQGRGAFVRVEPINVLMHNLSSAITSQQSSEAWDLAAALSCHSLRLASNRINPQQIEHLRKTVNGSLEKRVYTVRDDLDFHIELARIGNNFLFVSLLERVSDLIGSSEPVKQPGLSLSRHQRVLDAMVVGKVDQAVQTMITHIDELRR